MRRVNYSIYWQFGQCRVCGKFLDARLMTPSAAKARPRLKASPELRQAAAAEVGNHSSLLASCEKVQTAEMLQRFGAWQYLLQRGSTRSGAQDKTR